MKVSRPNIIIIIIMYKRNCLLRPDRRGRIDFRFSISSTSNNQIECDGLHSAEIGHFDSISSLLFSFIFCSYFCFDFRELEWSTLFMRSHPFVYHTISIYNFSFFYFLFFISMSLHVQQSISLKIQKENKNKILLLN